MVRAWLSTWSDINSFHLSYYNGNSRGGLTNAHNNTNVNFTTLDASFKHKYVVEYTCNWLTNGGSTTKQENIFKTMKGTRLMMGFALQMYLDSREASLFGYYMDMYDIRTSFIMAAQRYQPANDKEVIARVMGYTAAQSDNVYNSSSNAPYYTSSPANLSTISTVRIN